MIKVVVEVYKEPGCSTVSVEAETLLEALRIARESYPGGEVRVVFPIDPEGFFLSGPFTPAKAAGLRADAKASQGLVGPRHYGDDGRR